MVRETLTNISPVSFPLGDSCSLAALYQAPWVGGFTQTQAMAMSSLKLLLQPLLCSQ